jgi:hypothetical protein
MPVRRNRAKPDRGLIFPPHWRAYKNVTDIHLERELFSFKRLALRGKNRQGVLNLRSLGKMVLFWLVCRVLRV